MVSKNGPSLKEAMAPGGVVEQALMYFFSRKDRKIGNVPSKFSDKKELAKKLDQIKWNLKVPPLAIEVPAAAQPANAESDEEGGLVAGGEEEEVAKEFEEDELLLCWPEEEETLVRLNLVTLDANETAAFEAQAAAEEANMEAEIARTTATKKSSKRPKTSNQAPAMDPNDPNNPNNPRALRSRSGRIRRERVFLSYNHKDKLI